MCFLFEVSTIYQSESISLATGVCFDLNKETISRHSLIEKDIQVLGTRKEKIGKEADDFKNEDAVRSITNMYFYSTEQFFLWFLFRITATQGSEAYNPPGNELEVMVIIFLVYDSWGLYTWNICPGKNSMILITSFC